MLAACTIARAIERMSPALRRVAGSSLPPKASFGLNAIEDCRIEMIWTSGATPENPSAAGTAGPAGGSGPGGAGGTGDGVGAVGSGGAAGAGTRPPAGRTVAVGELPCQPAGGSGGGGAG